MTASPSSPAPGDAPTPRAGSLTEWLRGRRDAELARLLRLRPDLALPTPPDIASLAGRLAVRSSTQRAVDSLDAFTLRALENLVLAAGQIDSVDSPDPAALEQLFDRALVWGEPDLVHLTPAVRDVIGPYPAGLGRPAALLLRQAADAALLQDPAWVAARIAERDAEERDVLERLAAGPPVGSVRTTVLPAAGHDPGPAHRLISLGLLVPIDTQRVELPREVGLGVRAAGAGDAPSSEPPPLEVTERDPVELDRLGTTAVLEVLRLVEGLAESWTSAAPPVLRAGGVGVRDLRRSARDLAVDEAAAAVVIETMHAAGLLNATQGMEPVYLPTPEFDLWRARDIAQRWLSIAESWLAMTRQPGLVGLRGDRDRVIAALGPDVERGTATTLRRTVLDTLAGLAPGTAPTDRDAVLARLAWHQPRRATGHRTIFENVLREADLLGITAAGGLTGYTRTLLAGAGGAAVHALQNALPAAVDHFLVQPDLTVVVPGPPEADLGVELGLIADLESTGGASVYRITERSVRRALDAGRSARELAAFVTARSRTPVPQALSYLIEDASRRHGVLRVGTSASYLRCEDESLLARVVGDRAHAALGLRLLAPTVVIADAPVTRVLEVLREAGYAPAAESADGELVTLGVEVPRAPSRPSHRSVAARGATDAEAQVASIVRRLRSGDALAGMDDRVQAIAVQVPGVTSAATMELLRDAVRNGDHVWFGCAEADGTTTAHTVQPISLAAGAVRGYERGRPGLVSYPVHRITSIRVLEDDTLDDGTLDDDTA